MFCFYFLWGMMVHVACLVFVHLLTFSFHHHFISLFRDSNDDHSVLQVVEKDSSPETRPKVKNLVKFWDKILAEKLKTQQ